MRGGGNPVGWFRGRRSAKVDGMCREELGRLLDTDLLGDRPDCGSEALHRTLGLEDVEDEEAVRPFPGGVNQHALEGKVRVAEGLEPALEALAFDPQTSGGLLATVASSDAAALVAHGWARVGSVAAGEATVELR